MGENEKKSVFLLLQWAITLEHHLFSSRFPSFVIINKTQQNNIYNKIKKVYTLSLQYTINRKMRRLDEKISFCHDFISCWWKE